MKDIEREASPDLPPLKTIGIVRNGVFAQTDLGWASVESRILIKPEYRLGLRGLEEFSHATVLVYLHEAAFDPEKHLVRHPRGLLALPEAGIFAQRSKDRPNAIGTTVVPILRVDADGVVVRGLDAIDGTPVVDLKPFFPQFDQPKDPRVPGWVNIIMDGYF